MTESEKPGIGSIVWQDLTIGDAETVRDFYCDVVGWTASDHDMGDYADYNINLPGSGETVAGICHARGGNANMPAQWIIYIAVADVAASAARCRERGGKVLDGPRAMGAHMVCIIEDPAGAVAALVES